MVLNDITNRSDIYLLVSEFYVKLLKDDLLKPFFKDLNTPHKLETHLQILVDFWEQQLFYKGSYRRNAMQPHLNMHQKIPFKKEHFKQWLKLFNQTLNKNFEGLKKHQAMVKAQSIATVMQIKISQI